MSKASGRSWNQIAEVFHILLADISMICDKSVFHRINASVTILCRVCFFGLFGFGFVWLWGFFNLHGGPPLKYLVPIWKYSKRTLNYLERKIKLIMAFKYILFHYLKKKKKVSQKKHVSFFMLLLAYEGIPTFIGEWTSKILWNA